MLAWPCQAPGSVPIAAKQFLKMPQGTGGPSSFLSPSISDGDLLHDNSSVIRAEVGTEMIIQVQARDLTQIPWFHRFSFFTRLHTSLHAAPSCVSQCAATASPPSVSVGTVPQGFLVIPLLLSSVLPFSLSKILSPEIVT